MKKAILLCLLGSVYAAPALAGPETPIIYGNFRASANTGDLNSVGNDLDIVNNASRLGVKGNVGLGDNGLKGIYHLEMGVNFDGGGTDALSKRFYFAGVQGNFGKIIVGRLSTPYKMAGVKQDPFYDTSAGPANGGSNYGYSSLNNSFTDNSIAYYSPKIAGGFVAHALVSIDGKASDEHDIGFGVEYAKDGYKIGVAHENLGNTPVIAASGGAENATRVYGSANFGDFGLNASFEQLNFNARGNGTFAHINGTYKLNDKFKLSASYGMVDGAGRGSRNKAGNGVNAGVFYSILEKSQISIMYTTIDYDDNTSRNGLALGFVQGF